MAFFRRHVEHALSLAVYAVEGYQRVLVYNGSVAIGWATSLIDRELVTRVLGLGWDDEHRDPFVEVITLEQLALIKRYDIFATSPRGLPSGMRRGIHEVPPRPDGWEYQFAWNLMCDGQKLVTSAFFKLMVCKMYPMAQVNPDAFSDQAKGSLMDITDAWLRVRPML